MALSELINKIVNRTQTSGFEGRTLRILITVVAATGFSFFGYDQGVMGSLISADQFTADFPGVRSHGDNDRHATVVQGAVVSCYELGCFFGALFALFRGDKIGRKPLIIIGATIIIIGTIISVTSFKQSWSLGQFVIGRVITGIGNGMNTATIPVWQSEMSKPENRGRLVYIEGSTVAFGTFIAYWLDFGISYADGSVSWRFPIAFQIFFCLVLLIGILGLPESPRWLVTQGRSDEAQTILAKLEGVDYNDDSVVAELTVIIESVERFSGSQVGLKEMLQTGKTGNLQRVLIGGSTQILQQLTGCNAAIYYSTLLFEKMGQTHTMASIMGGVFSTVYFLSSIPGYWTVDSRGRRSLFLCGFTGQAIAFLITMGCLVNPTTANYKGAAVGLYLFIAVFGATILQAPWVYPPEINSLRARTVGTAVSTCCNWIFNFAVVMFTPIFITEAGYGAYLFFALINIISIPIAFFFYPETCGRTLEEIDIIFAKAFADKALPFRVAANLPKLSYAEIEEYSVRYGITDDDKHTEEQVESVSSKESSTEKSNTNNNAGALLSETVPETK